MWLNQYICDLLASFEKSKCFKLVVRLWLLTYGFGTSLGFKVTPDQINELKLISPFFPKLIFSFTGNRCRIKNINKSRNKIYDPDGHKVYCWILDAEYEQDMNKLLVLRVTDYGILKRLNNIPNLLFYK